MRDPVGRAAVIATAVALVLAACTGRDQAEPVTTPSSRPEALTTTTITAPSTASADPGLERVCDIPEYFPTAIPERAQVGQPLPNDAPFHPYLLLGGTSNSFLVDAGNEPVLAVIRGSLPPEPWAADPEVIEILDGVPAALGPLGDGIWAVAWVLSEHDPCDQYTLVLFPPASADEARRVAESLQPRA